MLERFADHLLTLGNNAYYERNLTQAAQYYRQCLALKPDFLVARYNLGVVYLEQEQWEAAKVQLKQVITADPNHPEAHNNLGIIYQNQHQLTEAIAHYRKAIHIRHHFPEAHFSLGMTLLQNGDFREGFAECEWRWQTKQFTPFICPHPQWDGRDIKDKTILIHTEQGSGDAIQFIRYIPLVAQRCRRVIVMCIPDLVPLFATVGGIGQLLIPGKIALSEFQTYALLMSLPHILGTTLETIPNQVPYLKALEDGKMKQLLTAHPPLPTPRLRVGIAWAGSPTHRNDYNRSCSLTDFLPVLKTPGVAFYSLQKCINSTEQAQLREFNVQDLSPYLKTFGDTAAAIAHLNLMISVDTAVVHLAGALGKPVWNLLCYSPDWRWMLERTDNPWYPTMRLFRQSQPRDWAGVFERVGKALRARGNQQAP